MGSSEVITSRANWRVKQVLKLRCQRGRRQSGLFIAEGAREVERALDADLVLKELYWCPQRIGADSAIGEWADRSDGAAQFIVTEPVLEKLAYQKRPEGVLAVFEQPNWSLEQFSEAGSAPDLWLVSVGAIKPGNVGAMARTAQAAGVCGLLLSDSVVDWLNPNAIRASTGAVFSLPTVAETGSRLVSFLRDRGVAIVAADPQAPRHYGQVDLTGPTALVVGAEDRGLDATWRAAASGRVVSIPMSGGKIDSLNAATTAAILLFEAVRQRRYVEAPPKAW